MSEEAFIYEAIRTPRGKQKNGSLHEVKPLSLVVGLIDELRKRHPDLDENLISDVILGCVSPVGDQGGDIARAAVLASGMPVTSGGVQLNRFCASGLEAVNTAAQKVRSGWDDLVLAGGVESMSRVPMGSDGGAMGLDPATNYDVMFVPQGIGADPVIMLTGPTPATRKVLDRAGLTVDDIDLFELNEAFASVVLKFQKDLNIPDEKLNVNGGAIAMGHPLGATGAMILGTMVDELERRNARRALITLCIGGGMGVATIIERV